MTPGCSPGDAAPTDLLWRGRKLRLKWHKLRRQAADPPFARRNLRAGLAAGASLEVDIRRLACGRFVCLHDDRLESETSGHGPVAAIDALAVGRLEMRGGEPPLLLDELAATLGAAPAGSARVQLDLRASADDTDAATWSTAGPSTGARPAPRPTWTPPPPPAVTRSRQTRRWPGPRREVRPPAEAPSAEHPPALEHLPGDQRRQAQEQFAHPLEERQG